MTESQQADNRERILIVDDERFNLTTLHELLKDEFRIMVAKHAEQGLKAALSGRPNLILLDINMPEMNGYEVCKRLKADPLTADIPIIFITALSEAADETRGLELGAADYITKPFNLSVVKARVNTQLHLKRQSDMLASLAFKDGLTSINNRRSYDDRLQIEWTRGQRALEPLSLMMIDVDHFKLYNDTYGHALGDECLKQIAQTLQQCTSRATDFVARYGGEEFVILLPNTNLEGGLQLAERIRQAVHQRNIEHRSSPVADCVTLSIGLVTRKPGLEMEMSQFKQAADKMLYQAKHDGRDRVVGELLD